jgi:hypothetical protein
MKSKQTLWSCAWIKPIGPKFLFAGSHAPFDQVLWRNSTARIMQQPEIRNYLRRDSNALADPSAAQEFDVYCYLTPGLSLKPLGAVPLHTNFPSVKLSFSDSLQIYRQRRRDHPGSFLGLGPVWPTFLYSTFVLVLDVGPSLDYFSSKVRYSTVKSCRSTFEYHGGTSAE